MNNLEKSLELLDKLFQEKSKKFIRAKIKEIDRLPNTGLPILKYFSNLNSVFDYNQLFSSLFDEIDDLRNFDWETTKHGLVSESMIVGNEPIDFTYSPPSPECAGNNCDAIRFAA